MGDIRDSLTPEEFVAGLHNNGFFHLADCPQVMCNPELAMKNLFSLLNADGGTCISREEMAFLEKDKEARDRNLKELQQLAEQGTKGIQGDFKNHAEKMIHNTLRS